MAWLWILDHYTCETDCFNMKKEASLKSKQPCFAKLKVFLVMLSLLFFGKSFAGSYMKSTITSIERRFDLPSAVVGIVDGSFEIGNLLVMAFVSYIGAKFHRPRVIAIGATIMSIGTLLIPLPHFLMDRYSYQSIALSVDNASSTLCERNRELLPNTSHKDDLFNCQHEVRSKMWLLVLLGNILRGIGETPIVPLGLSYLDDFSRPENSALYVGYVFTISIIGPIFGFLLGSFTTKLFVDIGFVSQNDVTITPKDNRWVGAWWLGFLITGVTSLLLALPFWFFPRSISGEVEESTKMDDHVETNMKNMEDETEPMSRNLSDLAKEFLQSLRTLFTNPVYVAMLTGTVFMVNGNVGSYTFRAKFVEQQFGESASKANFLLGATSIPAIALGIFLGGLLVKCLKLSLPACARLLFITCLIGWLLDLCQFFIFCENIRVPGLTTAYNGTLGNSSNGMISSCNADCACDSQAWDPVCGQDGHTYLSPCLGGCQKKTGEGKSMIFLDCQCVAESMLGNSSAMLGHCPRQDCSASFILYICLEVLAPFISCLGYTASYLIFIRGIPKDLKSFALGMYIVMARTLGGIPAPMYFGAALDKTCIRWSEKACSDQGACRLYNVDKFRVTLLSLTSSLRFIGLIFYFIMATFVHRRQKSEAEQVVMQNGQEDQMQASAVVLADDGTDGGMIRNLLSGPEPDGVQVLNNVPSSNALGGGEGMLRESNGDCEKESSV
uniref:solute carrier organic anion transporter family member 1C1-like n=1 Tax=Myxine glutinosa TaxID=7769 RepID=UPI00358F59A2